MAHSPRKPSTDRTPTASDPSHDLFPPASGLEPVETENASSDHWTLDESVAPAPRPGSLPPAGSTTSPSNLRISPISVPTKRPLETTSYAPPDAPTVASPDPMHAIKTVPEPTLRSHLESYDPFEIDEDLPPVAITSAPIQTPHKILDSPSTDQTIDNLLETDEDSVLDAETPPRPIILKPAGFIAVAIVLISLLGSFIAILYLNRPASEVRLSLPKPTIPLLGQLASLTTIETGWRSRQPTDLVSTVDVTLPTPSRQQSALLPMVRFKIDSSVTKTGFLRFIFFDPDGKISGDVRVVKVSGGSIDPLTSGAIASGPNSMVIYGSIGFMDRPGFVGYATTDSSRWSLEVSESASYNAKESDWAKLETFDLRNTNNP